MRHSILVFLLVLAPAILGQAEDPGTPTIRVGLPAPGRMPLFWQDADGNYRGTFVRLLKKIESRLNLNVTFEMLPQVRLIGYFNKGTIDLEPGVSPAWRPTAQEQEISCYTAPFMDMKDVVVFPKGTSTAGIGLGTDLAARLKGLTVAQVRGFYIPPGITVHDALNEEDIARLVMGGYVDAGFMNQDVAAYYSREFHYAFSVSEPFASTPVSFRLRTEKQKWVEAFNRVLADLRSTGELDSILKGSAEVPGYR